MPLKVPDVGEIFLLTELLNNTFTGAKLRLFKNDYTPVDGSTLANFTQANFSGYAQIVLNAWGVAVTVAGRASADHAPVNFTHNGGATANNIYGYYVVDATEAELLFAERDPFGPVTMALLADNYRVILNVTGKSEY